MANQPTRNGRSSGRGQSSGNRNPQRPHSGQGAPRNGSHQQYGNSYGSGQRRPNPNAKSQRAKKKKRKKIAIFVVEMIVLGLLLLILVGYTKLGFGRIDRQGLKIGDLNINELDSETQEVLSGYTSIAMFGIDNHDAGNFTNGRTDTIIVVSIDNDSKQLRMCSVYRDTYLNIGDGVYTKANAAYQNGGPTQAIAMLNSNLDLNIEQYITVDFNAMVDIIDRLGGITLTITQEELEAMCGTHRVGVDGNGEPIYEQSENYLETVAEAAGQEPDYNLVPGTQLCSGVTAVAYCRVRYTSGDDYKRSERQRIVIGQIMEKAKSSDIGTVIDIINIVFGEISTSLSNSQIIAMATNMMSYDLAGQAGFPFYKNTKSVGNSGSCVIPCDLVSNVDYLHSFLYNDEEYSPTETVKDISYTITQKSGYTRDDADDRLYGSVTDEAAAVPAADGAAAQ